MIYLINKTNNTKISINEYAIDSNSTYTFLENYTLTITLVYNKQIYNMLNSNYVIQINSINNSVENFEFDTIQKSEDNTIEIECTHTILKKLDKDFLDEDELLLNNDCLNILFENININYESVNLISPINNKIIDCLSKSKFDIFKEILNEYGVIYYILNNKLYIKYAVNQNILKITEDEIVSYNLNKDLTNYYNYVTFYTDTKDIKATKDFRENNIDTIYKKNEVTNIKNEDLIESYITKEDDLLNRAMASYYYNKKKSERYDYKDNSIDIQCVSDKNFLIGAMYKIDIEDINEEVQVLEIEYNNLINIITNIKLGKKEKEIIELIETEKEITEDEIDKIVDNKIDNFNETIKDTIDKNNENILDKINRKFYITGNIRLRNGEQMDVNNATNIPFPITKDTTIIPIISYVSNSYSLIGGVLTGFSLNVSYPNISCQIGVWDCNVNSTFIDNNAFIDFKILYIDESTN